MITKIKANKFTLIGLLAVIILFFVSVSIRKENLKVPMSMHHEWLTAHSLITMEIWEENGGPSAYHFSPIYTYPGETNQRRNMLGGIEDENGEMYYVSYPPFAFIFGYYVQQLMGGQSVENIRHLNIAIHFLCTLFFFFLIKSLQREPEKDQIPFVALTGAVLYMFSTGNLWIHGNLYFVDMLVQLWIILTLWAFVKIYRNPDSATKWILLFGVTTFLGVYTEWLSVFLAFFTGISFLVLYFIQKKKIFLLGFILAGTLSIAAVGLTVYQYSTIVDFETYKNVSLEKFNQRSGHESAEETPGEMNMSNPESFVWIRNHIDNQYIMAENMVGISAIAFALLLLVPFFRKKIKWFSPGFLVSILLLFSILMHYYLFFNFNTLHDFSALKVGFLMMVVTITFLLPVFDHIPLKFTVVLALALTYLLIDKSIYSYRKYHDVNSISNIDWDRIESYEAIKEYSTPEIGVYLNVMVDPKQVYATKRNVFPIMDTIYLMNFFNYFEEERGQFYFHDGSKLKKMVTFEKQGEHLTPIDSIIFNH